MTEGPGSTRVSRIARHAPTAALVAAAAIAFVAAGCTGILGDADEQSEIDDLVPAGAVAGGDDGDEDGDGDDGPGPSPGLAPPEPVLRRILSRHYVNAVRDVLGPAAAAVATPPSVGTKLNGFDSIAASTYALTDAQVRAFEESARAVAAEAMGDSAILARVAPCTPTGAEDEACMRTVVETHGRRAFRRTLTSTEVDAYVGLGMAAADEYGDFFAGVEYVVATTLQSPHFLYVVEIGDAIEGEDDLRSLTGTEVATRLSFFLADTTPTDALLDAAEAGELDDAAGVRAWAEQLVAEPGAKAGLSAVIEEVMRYSEFESTTKDLGLFPGYGDELEASMREETRRFVEAIFDEGGGLEELLSSPETFVDASLAELYGVDVDLAPGEWQRVTLPEEQGRAGLLGQAGFLAINAFAERTSPTRRGKVILESFVCYPPLSPPPGVETELPDTSSAKTLRERLEQHMTDPSCSGCHVMLDGIGFGLEAYDAIGRFRTTENGEPVDADSSIPDELPGLDGFTGGPFTGAREAGELLAAQPAVRDCLVRNLFRAALGHVEEEGEEIVIAEVSGKFVEEDLSLPELLVELASSDGFRIVGGGQ